MKAVQGCPNLYRTKKYSKGCSQWEDFAKSCRIKVLQSVTNEQVEFKDNRSRCIKEEHIFKELTILSRRVVSKQGTSGCQILCFHSCNQSFDNRCYLPYWCTNKCSKNSWSKVVYKWFCVYLWIAAQEVVETEMFPSSECRLLIKRMVKKLKSFNEVDHSYKQRWLDWTNLKKRPCL